MQHADAAVASVLQVTIGDDVEIGDDHWQADYTSTTGARKGMSHALKGRAQHVMHVTELFEDVQVRRTACVGHPGVPYLP